MKIFLYYQPTFENVLHITKVHKYRSIGNCCDIWYVEMRNQIRNSLLLNI